MSFLSLPSFLRGPLTQGAFVVATLLSSGLIASPIQYPETELPELAKLLEQARDKAPALVAQAIAQEESVARLDAAKSSYYPKFDLGANLGLAYDTYLSGNYADESRFGLGFNAAITRPLYHWGAIEATIRQAKLDFNNEELQRVFILRQTKRTLRADYLSLLVNQAAIEILRLRRQITQDNITRAQTDREQGVVSAIASEQANLALNQGLIDIEQVEAEQARILADYKRTIGWNAPLTLAQPIPLPDTTAVLAWIERTKAAGLDNWLQDHAEVQRRQNLIAREKEELIRVKSAQRPLIGLTASASQSQRNTAAENNVDTLSYFVGVGVSWNVFDGFATSAKKRETLLRERRLERQLEAYRAELAAQSNNLLTQINFLARQLQIDQRRSEIGAQTFASQERDAKEGRLAPQAFRGAQLVYNETQLAALRTRVRLILALNDFLDLTLPVAVDYSRSAL